ncbi:Serine/threonine-protein phosphatase 7 long form homolog, partial [Linum perenne]
KWDDRYSVYVNRARLTHAREFKGVLPDDTLITTMIERWRPETSTFHLPFGECTITLEDIAYITGLPVDGEAVTRPIPSQWGELFRSLLGTSPPDSSPGTLKNSWLKDNFSWLSPDVDDTTVEQYARAYILSMFGQFMFCERTGSVVHAYYLTVLRDWEAASRFSWGSAVLSVLYREMSKAVLGINATSSPRGDLGGWATIVQIWTYERISFLAPVPRAPSEYSGPLGLRYDFQSWFLCHQCFSMRLLSQHVDQK